MGHVEKKRCVPVLFQVFYCLIGQSIGQVLSLFTLLKSIHFIGKVITRIGPAPVPVRNMHIETLANRRGRILPQVPFSKDGCAVPVLLQHFGQCFNMVWQVLVDFHIFEWLEGKIPSPREPVCQV